MVNEDKWNIVYHKEQYGASLLYINTLFSFNFLELSFISLTAWEFFSHHMKEFEEDGRKGPPQ